MMAPEPHFIAMEYYALILNRTYRIAISGSGLVGVVARGLTAVRSADPLTDLVLGGLAVNGDLRDPNSYTDPGRLARTRAHRADFAIPYSEIDDVRYNPKRKWGMGYYPHDGRVLVRARGGNREFIILGRQSGQDICAWICQARDNAIRANDHAP